MIPRMTKTPKTQVCEALAALGEALRILDDMRAKGTLPELGYTVASRLAAGRWYLARIADEED
jgi:hypothetical protein